MLIEIQAAAFWGSRSCDTVDTRPTAAGFADLGA